MTVGPVAGEIAFTLPPHDPKEIELEIAFSLNANPERIDSTNETTFGVPLTGVQLRGMLELIACDALRSYADGKTREIALPCDVMGYPLGRSFEVNPLRWKAPQSVSPWAAPISGSLNRIDIEFNSIHRIDVRDVVARWHRIQNVVDREMRKRRSGRRS
jgi:hypothetical protein